MQRRPGDPQKKEKILNTAISLFLEKGYHGTTTAEIGKRADMSSAHMYIYFKNKEDLLVEAAKRMEAEHTAMSTELSKKCAGLDDKTFIDKFYEAQSTIAYRVRFIATCGLAPETAHLFTDFKFDFSAVFVPFLQDWLKTDTFLTAKVLMDIAVSYFLMGGIETAKAESLTVLRNARTIAQIGGRK